MSEIAADDPTTYSKMGAQDPTLLATVKVSYAALHIELITLAIQLVLCIYGLSHYKASTPSQHRNVRRLYSILSFVILAFFTAATVSDSVYFARLTISPGRFELLLEKSPWFATLGSLCNTIVILLGDGILVYRCYIIWQGRRWVVVIPCLALVASLVMAIVAVVDDSTLIYFSAWIAMSITVNTLSTALIVGKLVYERRRLSKVLAHGHLVKYITATAILVESAVPLTVVGIASSIILTQNTNISLLGSALTMWFCLSGLCPQLIIFRVAVGRSYTDLNVASDVVSRPIQFAAGQQAPSEDSVSEVVTDYPVTESREKGGGPFRGGLIPDELISNAKRPGIGSIDALYELFRNLSSSSFRMDLVDVVFHHLQPKWMLPPETSPTLSTSEREFLQEFRVEQAKSADFCTAEALCAMLLVAPPHLYGRVVDEVIAHLDDYFGWVKYLASDRVPAHDGHEWTGLSNPTRQCRAILSMMEEEDKRLIKAIVLSNQLIDFAITAWVAEDPATCDAYVSFEAEHLCPIVDLFHNLLSSEVLRQKIFDVLFASGKGKKLRMEVVRAAISRCSCISRMEREVAEDMAKVTMRSEKKNKIKEKMTALEAIFKYLAELLHVVSRLCLNADMSRAFMKSTFYSEFTQALRSWLLEKSRRTDEDAKDRHRGFKLLQMVESLAASQAIEHGDRHWKLVGNACLQIIKGGGIAILIEGMHSIQARDKRGVIVRHMLVPIQDQCHRHPAVAESMSSEIVKFLGESFWNTKTFAHTGWTKLWDTVSLDFLAGSLTPFKRDVYSLCDNLDCDRDLVSSTSSRMCSGCNSVVYCSDACQQYDWEELHRGECHAAREDYGIDQGPEKIRYRQWMRQYQAQLAANRAIIQSPLDHQRGANE
ncbi:hypothetical protein NMY22_g16818 [Coprinellus aureogranulatus]|nr:hypothetical protein NMY22_g16818 [Coprinellus aureogranulatus]